MRHLYVFVFPLRLLAFWGLFFGVFRVWFIGWFHERWTAETPGSAWAALWHAWPLDLSTAAYLIALPLLVWGTGLGLPAGGRAVCEKLIVVYNVLIFSILIFIFGANIFLYEEWHTPLNNRALAYFRTPAALLDSMSGLFKAVCVALYLLFVWLWWRLYLAVVGRTYYRAGQSRWQVSYLPLFLALTVLAMRGGLGVMPINESAVYYSPHLFDNHAATNTAWHLLHSLVETRSSENHYRYFDKETALKSTENLLLNARDEGGGDAGAGLLRRPNIVVLIMESMTAQVIGELGGDPGVCPNLSRLIREGILFDRIYSSGYRTDQGLVAILAGYPGQPDQSIVLLDDKASTLPSLPKILRDSGYQTLYVYGGELTFANIGVWLTHQRFQRILSEKDFLPEEKTQRWGVDDGLMLQRSLLEINRLQPPFFAALMTLSLHPPYDVPFESRWNGTSDPEKFRHSAAFADHAIGEFFRAAEQQPWYPNTLFVLVADHGNAMPGGLSMDQPESRQVPLIFFYPGFSPADKGRRVHALGNHHDVPATILKQIGVPGAGLPWSRPLLPETRHRKGFAYYTNENGLGWIDESGAGFYRFQDSAWQFFGSPLDSAGQAEARAYLQTLYEDFLER